MDSWKEFSKPSDSRLPNKTSLWLNSLNSKKKTTKNHRPTESKSKNYLAKTLNLVNRFKKHKRSCDCQLVRSVSWTMSWKSHAINSKRLVEDFKTHQKSTREFLSMKERLLSFLKKLSVWMELLKRRIARSELSAVNSNKFKRTWDCRVSSKAEWTTNWMTIEANLK